MKIIIDICQNINISAILCQANKMYVLKLNKYRYIK